MKLPTRERALFVLCEDVRSEAYGKVSFMGTFIGDRIVVHENPEAPKLSQDVAGSPKIVGVLEQLAIAVVLRDGAGEFQINLAMRSPSGKVVMRPMSGKIVSAVNSPATLVLKGYNIPIVEFGEYEAHLSIAGTEMAFPFTIVSGPPIANVGRLQPAAGSKFIKRKTRSARSAGRRKRPQD